MKENLRKDRKLLKQALDRINEGAKVDTNSLPLPIAPFHILGYSEYERIESKAGDDGRVR